MEIRTTSWIASLVACAALLSSGWAARRPGDDPRASPPACAPNACEPAHGEVPAAVVARALEAARARHAGGALPAGWRLLESLAQPHGAGPGAPAVPLRLTARVVGQLARNGMQPFLRRVLGPRIGLAGDTQPPQVAWVAPLDGAHVVAEESIAIGWLATDASPLYWVDVFASFDGGTIFQPIALYLWPGWNTAGGRYETRIRLAHRPGPTILRIAVTDAAFNVGTAERTIVVDSPGDSLLPTTLRDFDVPGTQPYEAFLSGDSCSGCHGNYDPHAEPSFPWSGSMMAHASLDPLFEASLAIAEQDADGAGDLCMRCHVPQAWVSGRATPSDGSQLLEWDRSGVSCDICHVMVDPEYAPGASPDQDLDVLASLSAPPRDVGNGSFVLDPTYTRRGPFADAVCAHTFLPSPFHQEAALCGTCHDQGNPLFEADGHGGHTLAFDRAASAFGPGDLVAVDRTYSEWLHSDYNSPAGVYAPELGGNREYVSTCQDCHMRDVTGQGCHPAYGSPVRDDLPLHDLTGSNTWMPRVIAALYPYRVSPQAINGAVKRARFMLQHAASLAADVAGGTLAVTVTNETGHKLPTGSAQGRRMWLHVEFLDAGGQVLGKSGHYDPATGVLESDPELAVFEFVSGIAPEVALLTGLSAGPSFHHVLNTVVVKDNRIPPRGFTNAAFASFGGAPTGATYADGQHWSVATYALPASATRVKVTLLHQTTRKEFVEFLRDANHTDARGDRIHDLWQRLGKCPPEVMARLELVRSGDDWTVDRVPEER